MADLLMLLLMLAAFAAAAWYVYACVRMTRRPERDRP